MAPPTLPFLPSASRDPPDLGLEADELVGDDRSSINNNGRGEATAKATRKAPSSKRANHASSSRSKASEPRADDDGSGGGDDSFPPPAPQGRNAPSYARHGGSGSGSGSAGSPSGKGGNALLRSRSALPLGSPRNTYGTGRFSRRSSEPSAATAAEAAAAVKSTTAVRAGGGGGGGEEEEVEDDDDGDGWFGEDGVADAATEEAGVDLESTVLADQEADEEVEKILNDTVVADDDDSNTDTDSETAARAGMAEFDTGRPAGRSGRSGAAVSDSGGLCTAAAAAAGGDDESGGDQQGLRPLSSTAPPLDEEKSAAAAGGDAGGDASPASPGSSEKFASWKVGGRGLLGRGSAKKTGRLLVTSLGSAGRVGGPARASAPMLASPGLYLDGARRGGGGRARGSRGGEGWGGVVKSCG